MHQPNNFGHTKGALSGGPQELNPIPENKPVKGVDSFVATGDPLLTSISNLRKERKKRSLSYMMTPFHIYLRD
jgi:hypothetical protein